MSNSDLVSFFEPQINTGYILPTLITDADQPTRTDAPRSIIPESFGPAVNDPKDNDCISILLRNPD